MSTQSAPRAVVRLAAGDSGARIHAIGRLDATLVYHSFIHCGDEDCGPAAELLSVAGNTRVYTTEDAPDLASRIRIGLP
jgi:hypothetical protein